MIVRWGSKTGTLECQFLATGAGNFDSDEGDDANDGNGNGMVMMNDNA